MPITFNRTAPGLGRRIVSGLRRFAEAWPKLDREIGVSGERWDGGLPVDPYNPDLAGAAWHAKVDEMRRVSGGVQAVEFCVTLPIMDTQWSVEGPSDEIVGFVEYALFEAMSTPWAEVVRKAALSALYGTWIMECVWTEDEDGRAILRRLADRLPATIAEYRLDRENRLESVLQKATDPRTGDEVEVVLPTDSLLLFPYRMEGGNWHGLSILRPAYKHFYCLDMLYRIANIGAERAMRGIPIGLLPAGYRPEDQKILQALVESLRLHETAGLTLPPGYKIEELGGGAMADLMPLIEHHRGELLRLALCQWVALGDTAGAYSLADPSTRFALMAWNSLASYIEAVFNRHLIPRLVRYNFGEVARPDMPRLRAAPVGQLMLLEGMADFLDKVFSHRFVVPDGERLDENWFRALVGLPEREAPAAEPATEPVKAAEPRGQVRRFAESDVRAAVARVDRDLRAGEDEWQRRSREHLTGILAELLRQLDGVPPEEVELRVDPALIEGYADWLGDWLLRAWDAAAQRLADEIGTPATGAPPVARLAARARSIAQHHAEAMRFEVHQAALRDESVERLVARFNDQLSTRLRVELTDEARTMSSAIEVSYRPDTCPAIVRAVDLTGSILVVETTNEARLAVAATAGTGRVAFSAVGDTCPLCRALDGLVFAAESDEAKRFTPPLHINCDCLWVAVEDDEEGPVETFTPERAEVIEILAVQHGHFIPPPEDLDWKSRYEPLRVPASPAKRDFVVRRVKDPETGEIVTELRWNRPRYELPGLDPKTRQTGITDIAERRPGVLDLPGKRALPDELVPSGPGGRRSLPPRAPAEEIARVEQAGRELGLDLADYADDVEIGRQANRVVETFRQAGWAAPDEVSVAQRLADEAGMTHQPVLFRRLAGDRSAVLVNPASAEWDDPAAASTFNFKVGAWSTPNGDHILRHDFAHAAHFRRDPRNYEALRNGQIPNALRARIELQVSRRATANPVEFVAEVAAGLLDGRTYEADIMALYRQYGGPEL